MHRTAYVVGRKKALNCSPCANESGLKKRRIGKNVLGRMFTFKVTDRNPAYCANCSEPINIT